MKNGLLAITLFFITAIAHAQNFKCKNYLYTTDTIVLDNALVLGSSIDKAKAQFFPPNRILLLPNSNLQDSIAICFRFVSPEEFKLVYQNRSELENSQNEERPPIVFPEEQKTISTDNLLTNGSISRGIASGNNQGLLINSDLNLQMQGDLGKGVRLTAAVADNNSPLQPDGTTLQIQDFDRVFVKIDKDSWFAVAGDYFMQQQRDNYFLKFNKKSRGLQYEAKLKSNYWDQLSLQTHAAISRGRFARNEIQGREGIQGPYRLTGSQNEAFIIIIAATEVVYLDGKKLERGAQNDYIINYNTAEIIFNPNVLITQYSRIIVEFQYADQNYSRVLFNQGVAVKKEKLQIRLNYFIEQDNKNQPFQAETSLSLFDSFKNQDARTVLAQAGDNPQLATISTLRNEPNFSNNKILYRKIDTLGFRDVLVYSASETTNLYTATFSNVGANNGNYIQINTTANGRVYAWVAPVNGIAQGNFEPIIQLVAPKRQQMATVAASYQWSKTIQITGELAFSQLNDNTFSALDKRDDNAIGNSIKINHLKPLAANKQWRNQLHWERAGQGFSYIERYRGVEFDRKWNRSLANPKQNIIANAQNIIDFSGEYGDRQNAIGYEFSTYQVANQFFGISPSLSARKKIGKRLNTAASINYLQSENKDSLATQVYDGNVNLDYQLYKNVTISAFTEWSQNQVNQLLINELDRNAFAYQNSGLRWSSTFKKGWSLNSTFSLRTDRLPNVNIFNWASDGYIIKNELQKVHGVKRFALISNLRFLNQNLQYFSAKREQFLQQRIEYADHNINKGYHLDLYVQSGTGREQKREFIYLEVPAGQGQYAWIDYNKNGIQELNEFEVSVFADQAKFIKLFNLTNDFVNANLHEANLSFRLKPAAWFNNKKFWKYVSNQFNINILQRNNSDKLLLLNPFESDSAVLSGSNLLRNTLLYNASKLGLEFTAKNAAIKQLLTLGAEEQVKKDFLAKVRYNFNSNWQIDASGFIEDRQLSNAFFINRNYQWQDYQTTTNLTWQNLKMRITAGFAYIEGSGSEGAILDLKQNSTELNGLFFYNFNTNTNIDLGITRKNIAFNGQSNSPLGFQILNGLVQGQNTLWSFNLRTLVSKNIQISIGYEGRKLPELSTIHIGRAEARYLF